MNRTKARRMAFEMIFEYGSGNHTAEDILAVRRAGEEELDDYSVAMLVACENNREKVDALIEKYSVGWTVQRMSCVTLAALRLAVCELLYDEKIPTGVTVNEAVELAKKYGEAKSYAFVNSVLGKISANMK